MILVQGQNLGLALAMALKFYIRVSKELKLKVRKFWGLVPIIVNAARKSIGGRLNRI